MTARVETSGASERAAEMTFDVIVDRDRASAEDAGGALLAARTLVRDLVERAGGSSRLLMREIIITRDGMYDGKLTTAARAGRG